MVPVWIVLILVALVVDPVSKVIEMVIVHDTFTLKQGVPFLYHLYRVLLKTFFINVKPGLTHWVVLKVFESLVLGTI